MAENIDEKMIVVKFECPVCGMKYERTIPADLFEAIEAGIVADHRALDLCHEDQLAVLFKFRRGEKVNFAFKGPCEIIDLQLGDSPATGKRNIFPLYDVKDVEGNIFLRVIEELLTPASS